MKFKNLITIVFGLLFFTSVSVFALSMYCDDCIESDCTCTVSGCELGDVLIYKGSGCPGFPIYDKEFSESGMIIWIPGSDGDYSFKVICSDNGVTEGSCDSLSIDDGQARVTKQVQEQSQGTKTTTSSDGTSRSTVKTTSTDLNTISTTSIDSSQSGNQVGLKGFFQKIKIFFSNLFG